MPLYNREDFELEMDILEQASQMLSGKVARGEISGFDCLRLEAILATRMRQAKGKLLRSRNLMADIRAAEKRVGEAANIARANPSAFAKDVVKACEQELGKMIARTKWNQSPFRVKAPDGEIVNVAELL